MNARLPLLSAAGLALATLFFLSVAFVRRAPDPSFGGRYASEWARDLLSADYKTRSDAQGALQRLGEAGVPQLRVMVRKENLPWDGLLQRLNRVVPGFNYRTCDAILARQRAAEMLGLLGVQGRSAVPELIALLANDQTDAEAERALVRIGADSIPALELALHSRNTDARRRSVSLLGEMGNLSKTSRTALLATARDPAAVVRKQAAATLCRATTASEAVLPALLLLSADSAPEVRAAAFASLGSLGQRTEPVVFALRRGLSDSKSVVQLQAAKALWRIERNGALAVPVLTRILGTSVGWEAAYALGEIGTYASNAIPALVKVLREERVPRAFRTPPSSAYALGQIGESAVPALLRVLTDNEPAARLSAVLALGFMGKKAQPAVPKLLALLRDRDTDVRHAAALTLPGIGANSEEIIEALSDCLQADDIYMRFTAAEALREIAPDRHWVVNPE
ncbi:MAG TPA: HEAT repeat domain-containing protein [Verrucomicrobiae bacterium]|nr:HEAT repeat domain-containing protein [Verrucomicrobiae bacterium]